MAGSASPSATPRPGFQWSCGSAFSQLLRNLSSRMAEGTGIALHVPAALPVSHGPERLPEQSGWHRPPPGPRLDAFGPSPSPEHCGDSAHTISQHRWPCSAGSIIQEIGVQRHAGPIAPRWDTARTWMRLCWRCCLAGGSVTARDKPLALLSTSAPRVMVPLPRWDAGFMTPRGGVPRDEPSGSYSWV